MFPESLIQTTLELPHVLDYTGLNRRLTAMAKRPVAVFCATMSTPRHTCKRAAVPSGRFLM